MEPPDIPMLLTSGLSFRYPGIAEQLGAFVHDGLSFTVDRGAVVVLIGAADAGKTTLARIVAGLVPRFSGGTLAGTVRLNGADITGRPPYQLMEIVGLVSQDSDEQIFTTRCDTEVAFALESMGLPRQRIAARVEESLRLMGLWDFRRRNPSTLSGGEKKRLLLACLWAVGPELWILDESLEELDQSWKAATMECLAARGRTMLVLDSRLSPFLAGHGNRFALLSGGAITASSDSAETPAFMQALSAHGFLPRRGEPLRRKAPPVAYLRAAGVRFTFPQTGSFSLAIESLELTRGEICALVGRNGSGKSTLGRILCGLILAQEGEVSVRGESGYRRAAAAELNRTVAYLFQNPDHQIYLPTVREELALGLRRQGTDRSGIDRKVQEAVELFSLPDSSTPPALMSYGARRRLQAATYYLLSREFLILDEVDAGLSFREVESLLDSLFAHAPGILLITHDLGIARAASDRILVMEGGRIIGDVRRGGYERLEALLGVAAT